MADFKPVVSALIGLGGYAQAIQRYLTDGEQASPPVVKLAAVTSSNPDKHPEIVAKLRERGVRIMSSYDEILADKSIETVWLPLPIDLHRPFTEQALAAGKSVMCEKPVAGCVEDVDAMIAAQRKAGLPVAIGYQDVYDSTTVPTKRLLLDGGIGKIERACVWACWPRDSVYYGRAGWAARFKRGDTWVMDSPANNALAHYINIALFLLGADLESAATPEHVEAELYRANDIENYDTIAMRLTLPGGIPFQVMFTHACAVAQNPLIEIYGSQGKVLRAVDQVLTESKGQTTIVKRDKQMANHMTRRIAQEVRGIKNPDIALATLESSRAQTVAINGASQASAVTTIPTDAWREQDLFGRGGVVRAIAGIEDAFRHCSAMGQLLHESGRLPWTQPAGSLDLRGYKHFAGPKGANLVTA